jgi:hypothetical protein
METNWATDHLQVIRTLMERSALYRRALAPLMMVSGSIGVAASIATRFLRIESNAAFSLFWLAVSLIAITAAYLLVRRQALKDAEPFWSLPTRRVTQALMPAFFVGFAAGLYGLFREQPSLPWLLAVAWIVIYGCALHAAGFFMQNRMRIFGWGFIVGGCAVLVASTAQPALRTTEAAHYLMGGFFGLLHLICGVYLYFTEKPGNAS